MHFQEIEQKVEKQKNKIYKKLVNHTKTFEEDWICDLRQEWIDEESNLPFSEFYQYHIEEYMEFYLHHYLLYLIEIMLKITNSDIDTLNIQEKNKLTEPFILKFKKAHEGILNNM